MGFPGFNEGGFGAIGAVFPFMFLLIIGVFAFVIIRGIAQWTKNNQQPELAVEALLVSKRTNVSRRMSANDNIGSTSSTDYYATFEVESGDRLEFRIAGHEYGLLAEGDRGKLNFQGTRYKGFFRSRSMSSS